MLFLCIAKVIELKKIKVGAVSYLNTKPFLYGIEHSAVKNEIALSLDYPAALARQLRAGQIDMALLPVAVLPTLPEYHFVGDYGIACDGEVASVALFSKVPLEQVSTILLDYQSRTSAALLKILATQHWKITPQFVDTHEDFAARIEGNTAALIIGDRALEQLHAFEYIYDLGAAWKDFTGLPFVFAAWVSNKALPEAFVEQFRLACSEGVLGIEAVVAGNPYPFYDLKTYYTRNIHFLLNEQKHKAIERFLGYLNHLKIYVPVSTEVL